MCTNMYHGHLTPPPFPTFPTMQQHSKKIPFPENKAVNDRLNTN